MESMGRKVLRMNLRFQSCYWIYSYGLNWQKILEQDSSHFSIFSDGLGSGTMFISFMVWKNLYFKCHIHGFDGQRQWLVQRSHVWVMVMSVRTEVLGMADMSCERLKEGPGIKFHLIKRIIWTCQGKWIIMVRDIGRKKRWCLRRHGVHKKR